MSDFHFMIHFFNMFCSIQINVMFDISQGGLTVYVALLQTNKNKLSTHSKIVVCSLSLA